MTQDPAIPGVSAVRGVLVIDDHPLYGDALAGALSQVFEGCTIRTATSLQHGLDQLGPDFDPDLVMLDLRLPDVTGISGFLRLRERVPDVPVLVISALSSTEVVEALMDSGAAGFISKDASTEELRTALMIIREGRQYLPPGFASVGKRKVSRDTRAPSVQDISQRIADLTPQQARIMKLICAGKPNKQIAYELSLAEATVKAHITALLRRLGVQNRTQAAVLVESANLESAMGLSQSDARAFLSE
ncbi:Transcriptional regulator, LuxR family [Rhodovulum sp. P5]|uniref:response regulator n=1 Tax=Rhodovulum sp. P5 TaxID=1564506 RepID=UPI0009C23F6D|nr:response regulator transcription factor [Rhodovulum sp. P5]ARE39108.1 Transcriptional regulator, LuxR family [Rhodovulum sp. P5]